VDHACGSRYGSLGGGSRLEAHVLKHKTVKVLVAPVIVIMVLFCVFQSGDYLVVNRPDKSSIIVVLAGDHNDLRYWRGLELLREGYGQQMIVDATDDRVYGRSLAEHAASFVAQSAGEESPKVRICTITNDSTVQEASNVGHCLAQVLPAPGSVLLVTNDYHTRRALSVLNARLPQYHWSAAAVNDPARFGDPWWHNREWAKTYLIEWEKLLWWKLFESWRT
jgi:uncharacterized SAM-binding protein YcdF (DUF218 family)